MYLITTALLNNNILYLSKMFKLYNKVISDKTINS